MVVELESIDEPATVRMLPARLLQTLIVSGSRVEELQEESAQRVEAVTRQQILATGYERVSDLLAEIPGGGAAQRQHECSCGRAIQGIDSRHVAVLQDGLPVPGAPGVKSGVVNLNHQSITSLQRIEVAKDAASASMNSPLPHGRQCLPPLRPAAHRRFREGARRLVCPLLRARCSQYHRASKTGSLRLSVGAI
ncbi:MAG: TonB-dependent receptor plug domain-containing protein [Bryobacteraceae bacterium]